MRRQICGQTRLFLPSDFHSTKPTQDAKTMTFSYIETNASRITQETVTRTLWEMDQRKVLVRAYRSLYRTALRAVFYASPARYQIRDTMRTAFSADSKEHFDPWRVKNTIEFLERAGAYTGTEHKILRNLLHVRYWQSAASKDTRL